MEQSRGNRPKEGWDTVSASTSVSWMHNQGLMLTRCRGWMNSWRRLDKPNLSYPCKGYWQVPLSPASRPYTAFRTPLGLYQFTVFPFGLHGAPDTFQRLMDRVLQGCEEWSAAYLDDVVIHSNSWAEHLQQVQQTIEKIQAAGLKLNVAKCEWAQQEASYLGYYLGNGQQQPQVDNVEAVERLQILFKWFNLDSYYPRPDSMYNCALSQSSHVDCQTLICVNPCQTWIRFRLIELVSMHLIMLMRLEPREVW